MRQPEFPDLARRLDRLERRLRLLEVSFDAKRDVQSRTWIVEAAITAGMNIPAMGVGVRDGQWYNLPDGHRSYIVGWQVNEIAGTGSVSFTLDYDGTTIAASGAVSAGSTKRDDIFPQQQLFSGDTLKLHVTAITGSPTGFSFTVDFLHTR
jgi:hypothetical protein